MPDSVVGHSSGEITAAYAAGAIDVEDAIIIAYMRGQATKLQTQPGAMAAVGRSATWVRELLPDGVVVACENSGSSTTVSGDSEAVLTFIERAKEADAEVFVRLLRVEQAYHSREFSRFTDSQLWSGKPDAISPRPYEVHWLGVSRLDQVQNDLQEARCSIFLVSDGQTTLRNGHSRRFVLAE